MQIRLLVSALVRCAILGAHALTLHHLQSAQAMQQAWLLARDQGIVLAFKDRHTVGRQATASSGLFGGPASGPQIWHYSADDHDADSGQVMRSLLCSGGGERGLGCYGAATAATALPRRSLLQRRQQRAVQRGAGGGKAGCEAEGEPDGARVRQLEINKHAAHTKGFKHHRLRAACHRMCGQSLPSTSKSGSVMLHARPTAAHTW